MVYNNKWVIIRFFNSYLLIQSFKEVKMELNASFSHPIPPNLEGTSNNLDPEAVNQFNQAMTYAIEIISNNVLKNENDLDELIYKLQQEDPTVQRCSARYLWTHYPQLGLQELFSNNVLQTKLLTLYESSALAHIYQNSVESIQQAIATRQEAAHLIKFSENHPLYQLEKTLETKDTILNSETFGPLHMGVHFNKLDTGLLKGSNLRGVMKQTSYEDKISKQAEFTFDINPAFRERIDLQLQLFDSYQDIYTQQGLSYFIQASQFTYQAIKDGYFLPITDPTTLSISQTGKIVFPGLGSIDFGIDPTKVTNYNRIVIQLEPNKNLEDLQAILVHAGLAPLLGLSSENDQERAKIAYLLRAFYPREAFQLERSLAFFEIPLERLKQQIIASVPQMEQIFQTELSSVDSVEILPGKIRYTIPCLPRLAFEHGAIALTHIIAGATLEAKIETLISCLKYGLLATQQRWDMGAFYIGQSSLSDHENGGADSVFTTLLTLKEVFGTDQFDLMEDLKNEEERVSEEEKAIPLEQLSIDEKICLDIKLKALELNPYQYNEDIFGSRNPMGAYPTRPSLLEFITDQVQDFMQNNEVMFKNRLSTNYFFGIRTGAGVKLHIIKRMREEGLLTIKNEKEYYQGIPIHQFILETPSLEEYKRLIKKYGFE